MRQAVCLFSDIGWRRHPDDRALGAFKQVLTAPFAGADHRARALIATAIFHRYSGDEDFPEDINVTGLLGEDGATFALRVGLAARLAFALTSAIEGELPHMPLKLTSETVTLQVPSRRKALLGETVEKRLDQLAEAFGRRAETALR